MTKRKMLVAAAMVTLAAGGALAQQENRGPAERNPSAGGLPHSGAQQQPNRNSGAQLPSRSEPSRSEQAELREPVAPGALRVGQEEIHHQHDAGRAEQHHLRQRGSELEWQAGRRHCLLFATWTSRSDTEACITSVNGLG